MRLIPDLPRGVEHCAGSPTITSDPEGFFDTGTRLAGVDPPSFISAKFVRAAGEKLGWPSEKDYNEVVKRGAVLEDRVAELEAELATADACLEAVDTLESAGFRARKKPGRPKSKEQS